jgi:hypothetical protein
MDQKQVKILFKDGREVVVPEEGLDNYRRIHGEEIQQVYPVYEGNQLSPENLKVEFPEHKLALKQPIASVSEAKDNLDEKLMFQNIAKKLGIKQWHLMGLDKLKYEIEKATK